MTITKEELKKLLREPDVDLEKITTLSSDGRNLLTRVPREIVQFLNLHKGAKVRWLVKADSKEIKIEIL